MESWRVPKSVVADSHHFEEDPDPDFSEMQNPDLNLNSDANPQPCSKACTLFHTDQSSIAVFRIPIQPYKPNTDPDPGF
jgi:hypothetical protein